MSPPFILRIGLISHTSRWTTFWGEDQDYIQNFDSMFPECEQTLNSKVGPTTVVSNSVYADQEAIEKTGSGSRQKFMDKHKDRMKNVTTYVGEVTLSK